MTKLKQFRKLNHYSYQQMAEIIGISKTMYWQLENKERKLTYEMAVKISAVFKMKPDQLFFNDFNDKMSK